MPKGELIGHCGVDSGQILLIDPCYVYKDEFEPDSYHPTGGDYDECCRITLSEGAGQTELGVVTSSGYGDGTYPVYAEKDGNGRVKQVTILFT